MTAPLPSHVAPADEPIPELWDGAWVGPDMRSVTSIEAMLAQLSHVADDPLAYVDLWRSFVREIGNSVSADYARDGTLGLLVGGPCDAQVRHRSRWQHFLCEHLHLDGERRATLLRALVNDGCYSDNRPSNPRVTTAAMRGFLAAGGRIMIGPSGRLEEGGDAAQLVQGDPGYRAYFQARRKWRSGSQIKRAVQMLGHRTGNGWIVLEARHG